MTGQAKKWLRFRIVTILVFFLVLYIALVSRAFQLQVLSANKLQELAARQHFKTLQVPSERGVVFDRNGEKLAVSVMADSVCADPAKIAEPAAVSERLAPHLGIPANEILARLQQSKNFCWLARMIPPEQSRRIDAMKIAGVFVINEPKRFYPNGELAGHLLGFVGLDSTGLEGLEKGYDEYVKGAPRKLAWVRDAKGKPLYPRVEAAAVRTDEGHHLILTIDSRLQYLVESQLQEAIKDKGAKGGFAIVMDPKTGEILAMADEPGFDPNNYSQYAVGRGKNRAINECFDPGSTFKPFVAAGALEEGAVRETDRFYCENGAYRIANRVIHEAQRKRHGVLTVHDILKFSSNIGSVKISERLGQEKFYHYIRKFGFGARTGIDLPGESPGLLRPQERWTRVDASNIAFGQGISVTAMQLVTALSVVANGGVLMKPYVVKGVVNKKGEIVKVFAPTPVRRVIAPETARRLTAILTDVVGDDDGTGKRARIANVAVAGKTGTSQKLDAERGVYSSARVRTSFMGFFPAEDPQIAMLITLDEPQRDRWGGMAAAPVFKAIGEQILTRFKTELRESPFEPTEEAIPPEAKVKLVSAELPVSAPAEPDESAMPDFRGLTLRDALKKSREKGIELKVQGSGWAMEQNPAPGTSLLACRSCTVTFGMGGQGKEP